MKKTTRILSLILALVMVFTIDLIPAQAASKASKQKEANKAYAAAIKNGKVHKFDGYGLMDLTGDGVKELVVKEERKENRYVYSYVNGKVKKVYTAKISGTWYAKGSKSIIIPSLKHSKNKKIYTSTMQGYRFNGKKFVKYEKYIQKSTGTYNKEEDEFTAKKTTYYKVSKNGKQKKISKKTYNKLAGFGTSKYYTDIWPTDYGVSKAKLIKILKK